MYGIDIAKDRCDEQDKQILIQVLSKDWNPKRCLILGSGEGRIGIVLALLGFEVVCIDIGDYKDFYERNNALYNFKKPIQFIQRNVSALSKDDFAEQFSLVLAQRMLHYLPYKEHVQLLNLLPSLMHKGALLYTAVSCIDSVMGDGYPGLNISIEERFDLLSEEMQGRFSLLVPVCLFSLKEYKRMMSQAHFKKVKLYQTAFGNIKGEYKKV